MSHVCNAQITELLLPEIITFKGNVNEHAKGDTRMFEAQNGCVEYHNAHSLQIHVKYWLKSFRFLSAHPMHNYTTEHVRFMFHLSQSINKGNLYTALRLLPTLVIHTTDSILWNTTAILRSQNPSIGGDKNITKYLFSIQTICKLCKLYEDKCNAE